MATRQDIELRIRARDYSKQDLTSLIGTLKDLRSAQEGQLEAAKSGAASANELEASYRRLESVGKALLSQQGLISTWQAQNDQLAQARTRSAAAREALERYSATLEGVTKRSKDQTLELRNRTRESKAAETAEARLETALSRTGTRLERYGIAVQELDGAQAQVRNAIAQTNAALERQDSALEGYESTLRATRAAEQQKIERERQLNEELAENERLTRSLAEAERARTQGAQQVVQQRDARLAENDARAYQRWWAQALEQRDTNDARTQAEITRREREEADTRTAVARAAEDQRQAAAQAAAQREREIGEERERQQRRQAQDYVRFWSAALDKVEAAERQAAEADTAQRTLADQRVQLNRIADEALAAGRGYAGLATAVRDVSPAAGTAVRALREAFGQEQITTIDQLEDSVQSVGQRVSAIRGPVENLRATMAQLTNAQKVLNQQAGQVDGYQRQLVAVGAARAEYVQARGELQRLAAEMRNTDSPTAEMNRALATADTRLRTAATAMGRAVTSARTMRQGLREAGIATNGLAAAEGRLVAAANATRATVDQLSAAHDRYGEQVRRTRSEVEDWGTGERTTLGFLERIRGEILALTTSYFGLQGGISLATLAIDRFKQQQALMSRLMVANAGDSRAAADELQYIREQADRLGMSYLELGQSYASFSIGSRAGGFSLEETRFTFEKILGAARAQNLSADDTQGVLRAVEQIIGKGAVQAEELRGQLGDRLAGAVTLFAQATDRSIPELTKAMENGEVGAREVINFARQLGETNSSALEGALNGVVAAEGRLRNALDNFYIRLTEGGFIDRYTEVIAQFTDLLNSQEGQQLADAIGKGFERILDLVIWCTQNLETMKSVLSILGTAIALRVFASMSGAISRSITSIRTMFGELATLRATLLASGAAGITMGQRIAAGAMIATRAIPLIGQALILADIVKIAYDQSDGFATAMERLQGYAEKGVNYMVTFVTSTMGALADLQMSLFRSLTSSIADSIRAGGDALAGFLESIGADGMASRVRSFAAQMVGGNTDFWANYNDANAAGAARAEEIEKKMQARLADIRKRGQGDALEQADAPRAEATPDPGTGVDAEQRRVTALGGELDRLEDQLKKQDIASRRRDQRGSLQGRLSIIDEEFQPLRDRAAAIGDQGARVEAEARIERLVGERKLREQRDYQTEQRRTQQTGDNQRVAQAQNVANTLESLEAKLAAAGVRVDPNTTYEDRLAAALQKVNVEYTKAFQAAAKLGQLGDTVGAADAVKKLEAMKSQSLELAAQQTSQQELERLSESLNELLSLRQQLLANIAAQYKAGLIGEQQMMDQTDDVNRRLGDRILGTQKALQTFAEAHPDLFTEDQLASFTARMGAVKTEIESVGPATSEMSRVIAQSLSGGATTAFDSLAGIVADLIQNTKSLGDAFSALGQVTATFFAQLLRDIATAILRQMILNALVNLVGGGIGAAAQTMGGVSSAGAGTIRLPSSHNGSVAGSSNQTRYLSNASGYNLPGLRSSEIHTVVERGEEILSRSDPRNVLNAGRQQSTGTGQGDQGQRGLTAILLSDERDIPAAMQSAAGDEVSLQWLRRNKRTVKAILK